MEYKIKMSEIHSMVETIEAESEAEAMAKIKAAYENGEIEAPDILVKVDIKFEFV
ncbi:MAG: hypothetical protein IJ647_10570 [Prevotella sp.]|nr:hypothetical protein [Prevotella sp.]